MTSLPIELSKQRTTTTNVNASISYKRGTDALRLIPLKLNWFVGKKSPWPVNSQRGVNARPDRPRTTNEKTSKSELEKNPPNISLKKTTTKSWVAKSANLNCQGRQDQECMRRGGNGMSHQGERGLILNRKKTSEHPQSTSSERSEMRENSVGLMEANHQLLSLGRSEVPERRGKKWY